MPPRAENFLPSSINQQRAIAQLEGLNSRCQAQFSKRRADPLLSVNPL